MLLHIRSATLNLINMLSYSDSASSKPRTYLTMIESHLNAEELRLRNPKNIFPSQNLLEGRGKGGGVNSTMKRLILFSENIIKGSKTR